MLKFTAIGEKYYTDKIDVGDAIESLQWEEVTPKKTYPMAQGMAIEKAIQEIRIPKVSHVAYHGILNGLGFYGIRAHYKQGEVDIFIIDDGISITPIATETKWN